MVDFPSLDAFKHRLRCCEQAICEASQSVRVILMLVDNSTPDGDHEAPRWEQHKLWTRLGEGLIEDQFRGG